MRNRILSTKFSLENLVISLFLLISLFFCWFVSEPARAAKIDRYILYYVDEVIRYFHAKASLYNPLINFLNPYAKPLSMIISNFSLRLLPFGMISIRIMNALFSAGTLVLLVSIMKKLGFSKILTILAILMTATFPVYFLSSFSLLSEPMFTFFLILAIYLYYSGKYFLSSLVISLSPLIRQEGAIYLCIWLFLLLRDKKERYILFLFIPLLLWIIANKVILGQPPSYIFLFLPRVMQGGLPPDSLLNIKDLSLAYFAGFFPMLLLFLAGLKTKILDKRYFLFLICILPGLALIVALNIFILITRKHLVYELRFLIPIVPLVNIYVMIACNEIIIKYIKNSNLIKYFLILFLCIMVYLNFYQMKQLQKLPYVLNNIVTAEQEGAIEQASNWLEDYLQKEGIENVSYRNMTQKVIRRVLMYLSGNKQFYVLGDLNLLNVVTFKLEPLPKSKIIFLTISGKEDIINKLNLELIKEFPSIHLYIYLFDNR